MQTFNSHRPHLIIVMLLLLASPIALADRGDRIDHRLDRKGDRIDHRLDRQSDRAALEDIEFYHWLERPGHAG